MPAHDPHKIPRTLAAARVKVNTEPALISSLVVAVLNLAAAFGLNLSGDQTAAINAVVGVVLAIVFVRPRVTPSAK